MLDQSIVEFSVLGSRMAGVSVHRCLGVYLRLPLGVLGGCTGGRV
jgi:hypothetical protein